MNVSAWCKELSYEKVKPIIDHYCDGYNHQTMTTQMQLMQQNMTDLRSRFLKPVKTSRVQCRSSSCLRKEEVATASVHSELHLE